MSIEPRRVPSGTPSQSLRPPPEAPRIPDHDVLRCIGRGSYGEVWMARAVTGVLRAVKVVRRDDFELDRTFEREFEGIRSFEPISRSHPGLIDILHVGRNQLEGFYYCVMELADDRFRGRAISPADYEPRTLGTDKRDGERLELDRIIEVGLMMADALAHLHKHGLIHRDVKPSNIIFVDGVAQLADIGLVAVSGQRTFVGTEGFVPPEGPGTPQADTFSLGMVLYELSTGKDRLEFPAVPDDIARFGDRKKWRALNEVVCRACAPQPKHRYANASEMADDLRLVLHGKARRRGLLRRKRTWAIAAAAVLLAIASRKPNTTGTGPTIAQNPAQPVAPANPEPGPAPVATPVAPPVSPPEAPKVGTLRVTSDPTGAEIFINGVQRGVTPGELTDLEPGEVALSIKAPKHKEFVSRPQISVETPAVVHAPLEFQALPVRAQAWNNSLGMLLNPSGREHVAAVPTTREHYVMAFNGEFPEGEVLAWTPPDGSEALLIVFVPKPDAEAFCRWLEQRDRKIGYFGPDHYYRTRSARWRHRPNS